MGPKISDPFLKQVIFLSVCFTEREAVGGSKPNSKKQQIPPKMPTVLVPLLLLCILLSSDNQIEGVQFQVTCEFRQLITSVLPCYHLIRSGITIEDQR